MLTVAKLAGTEEGAELAKALFDLVAAHMPEAELADTGGIDEAAAGGEVKELGGGGGVGALAGAFRQAAYAQVSIR